MPSISSGVPFDPPRHRFVVLQPVELAGMKVARRGGRLDDHLDNRRREPHDFFDLSQQFAVQPLHQRPSTRVALGLAAGVERRQIAREQFHDVRKTVLRRRHRFDDVAGVTRVVVAVVRHEPSVPIVGREEPAGIRLQREPSVAVVHDRVRLEELLFRVELKRAWAFLLVGDVRRRSRRDEHRPRRQRDRGLTRRTRVQFIGGEGGPLAREHHRANGAALVGHRFDRD